MSIRDLLPKHSRRLALGLAMVAFAVVAQLGGPLLGQWGLLDRLLYDARLQAQSVRPSGQILIVDIDEASLSERGPWPWTAELLAELLNKVGREGGARTLGIDLVLPVAESPGMSTLEQAVAELPVVVGFRFSNEYGLLSSGRLPSPTWSGTHDAGAGLTLHAWRSFSASTPGLAGSARASGFFNAPADRDGTVRSLPLVARYKDGLYPSLALAVLQADSGAGPIQLLAHGRHGYMLTLGRAGSFLQLPMSKDGTVLVPVQGGGGAASSRFRHLAAADVLAGRIDPRLFQDRIVLIGASSPAIAELKPSASGERFTEVELQASLIAGALDGSLRTVPQEASLIAAVLLGVLGSLIAVAMAAAGIPGVLGLMGMGLSILLGWNAIAFSGLNLVLPLGAGFVMMIALALINLVAVYRREERTRRAMLSLFGQYVTPELVAKMADDPHHAPMQSQDKEVTILFADIRGFTRMAERMDPQQLREVLNRFLTLMTQVVHEHHGTLDKYIGDAVMAFWGAPIDDPQHADHAVSAGIAMQNALKELNVEFERRGLKPLSIGIGINTGVVRVGDMGSQLRRSYTVIGDAVNLAARLESISKLHDIPVAIGESTCLQVGANLLEFFGETRVPGRDELVRVWQPVAMRGSDRIRLPAATEQPLTSAQRVA